MLSIIIPIYNREDLLPATLDSILSQTRSDWECILVDDQSTDRTVEVAQEYCRQDSRFRLFRRSDAAPKGPSACRNQGFAESRGDWIYFLDSDDLIDSRFAETFVPELENRSELDYLLFRYTRFDGDVTKVVRQSGLLPKETSIPEAMAAFQIAQGTQYFLWRRTFLEQQSPLWREDLSFGEDRELNFRLVCAARNGKFIPDPVLVYYRRNRKGLCFVRRFDKSRLDDTLKICKSFIEVCQKQSVSEKAKQSFIRYIIKNMRNALKFGDRRLMLDFYELAAELSPDRSAQKQMDRLRRHSLLYTITLRPLLLISALFARLAARFS